jgi:hypothetical protein
MKNKKYLFECKALLKSDKKMFCFLLGEHGTRGGLRLEEASRKLAVDIIRKKQDGFLVLLE